MATVRELQNEGVVRIKLPGWGAGQYVALDGEWAAINAPGRNAQPVLTRMLPPADSKWEPYGNQSPLLRDDTED